MAKRTQQTETTTPRTANSAQNDGACRCDSIKNVWGGRTTHWTSQHDDQREGTTR